MSVKKEASGRRSIQVEAEVPGTPEEVWQAIATGPGISAWFVPTQVEEREGGKLTCSFGPGMDSVATVTSWEPPHRFTAESGGFGPNAPNLASEWTVEARDGGKCVVRVVHSLFATTDDWDDQLAGTESGWPAFFRILRLYLEHFRGQQSAMLMVPAMTSGATSEVWKSLTGALGLEDAALGAGYRTKGDAPPISGVVEWSSTGNHPHLLLRIDEPAPGAAILNACAAGPQTFLSIGFYFYGDGASAAAAVNEPAWQAWMAQHFPAAVPATNAD